MTSDVCGLLGFPSSELGPAVISLIGAKPEITMRTLILVAIRCSLMFLVTASLFSVRPAQAYTVTLEQMGSNVVANGSGAINLIGLGLFVPFAGQAEVNPSAGFIITGPASLVTGDTYVGFLGVGPNVFGNGFSTLANSGSGDMVGLAFVGIPSILIVSWIDIFHSGVCVELSSIPHHWRTNTGRKCPNGRNLPQGCSLRLP